MLAPVIDRVFDLDAILRSSVGLSWSSLPPDQQDQLRSAFRRYTTGSYVNSFDHFDGQRFTVEPQLRPPGNGDQIVVTRITPRSGDSHEIDYVMRNTPSGWRAVDVLADGAVSRVAVQRSPTGAVARRADIGTLGILRLAVGNIALCPSRGRKPVDLLCAAARLVPFRRNSGALARVVFPDDRGTVCRASRCGNS